MGRLRQDPITWQWVIAGGPAASKSPAPTEPCPFCPAQQAVARETVLAERPTGPGWQVRVVADRAPLLRIEGELDRAGEGLFDSLNAIGAHEIIIEGREHNASPGSLSAELWRLLFEVFRDRILDLKRDARFRYVEVFQNYGSLAGALVAHPHAQVIAAPVLPHRVERELRAAERHYELKERCLYCDLIRQESHEGTRVVAEQDGFLLLCPYASRYPYEMWLLPRRHQSRFEAAAADADLLVSLAGMFSLALRKVERISSSFHFVLHTEPSQSVPPVLREQWKTLADDYHWHIELLPRVETRQKYLREDALYLNPILPEEAARELRNL